MTQPVTAVDPVKLTADLIRCASVTPREGGALVLLEHLLAGAGFDWLLIDGEHGPNDIPLIASQLAAMARHPAHAVVRLVTGEPWLIKQALDVGAQSRQVGEQEAGVDQNRLVVGMGRAGHRRRRTGRVRLAGGRRHRCC